MAIAVNTTEAKESIIECIKHGLVPMLAGSPGVGKSAIVHEIAAEYNLKVIDLRLSQMDPCDLNGFPNIDRETGLASYYPMDTFPLTTTKIPEGYEGYLIFLDEFNSAPLSVQAAAYRLVLDREVGQHKLHPNCAIVCAGNKETDNAIVNRMSTAMQSRLVHLELDVDYKAWLEWARKEGIDYRICSYIEFKPDNLYKFHPDHNDKTYAAPRTWEFASRLVKGIESIGAGKLPLLAGTLSEGVAREFMGFCKIFQDLPTIAQIIANPDKLKLPTEPSVLYALTGSIGNHATQNNLEKLMVFVKRLPAEFQVVTMRDMFTRNRALVAHPQSVAWLNENASELL